MKTRYQLIFRTALLLMAILKSATYTFASDFYVDGIAYNIIGNEAVVTYFGTSYNQYPGRYKGTVSIPPTVTHNDVTYTVSSIGDNAFRDCYLLSSVTIPNSVTVIGQQAFADCTGLTSIVIPNSVTSIARSAFHSCSGLTSVAIGNSVTSIGDYTFYKCSGLTSVAIGNSVTSIGEYAFGFCRGLTSVDIPNSVIYIGESAFRFCRGLTSVTIGNSVTSIGEWAFYECSGLTNVALGNSVTSIGKDAFGFCSGLTSVDIPNSVTSIGERAFSECSGLTSVDIPNSVTSIGKWAFEKCTGLTRVKITDLDAWCRILFGSGYYDEGSKTSNPLYYAHHLFLNGEEIKDLVLPNSVNNISALAFEGCTGLTSLTIPNSVIYIGSGAFEDCSGLESVTIPNSLNSIYSYVFSGCTGLMSVDIPNSVTTIGEYAFSGCSGLTSVDIPNSVISIGFYAFSGCSGLTSVIIPDSVTYIFGNAFDGCSGLTCVTIGNSVTKIGNGVFYGCNLRKVICLGEYPPELWEPSYTCFIDSVYRNALLCVPEESVNLYISTAPWSSFFRIKAGTDEMDYSLILVDSDVGPTNCNMMTQIGNGSPIFSNVYIYMDGEEYPGYSLTGLTPESSYTAFLVMESSKSVLFNRHSFTTPALSMEAKAADMVTNKDVRLVAETNMADVETSCGFEWRRYDAPEEMPNAKVYCPVYGGTMAGTLKNMSENVYYKYRPFYKSSAGNEYYGDWVAFITADAGVEFEPVVYTYNSPVVTKTDAALQGVALRGSEEITEQGFEYWKAGKTTMLTEGNNVTKVTARGERMCKTVEGLTPNTKYKFHAYVIAGGETTYGADVEFVTQSSGMDVNLDGEVNIADVNAVIDLILSAGGSMMGDVNGDGEVNIADINAIIDEILSN